IRPVGDFPGRQRYLEHPQAPLAQRAAADADRRLLRARPDHRARIVAELSRSRRPAAAAELGRDGFGRPDLSRTRSLAVRPAQYRAVPAGGGRAVLLPGIYGRERHHGRNGQGRLMSMQGSTHGIDSAAVEPVLSVRDLVVEVPGAHGITRLVDGASFDVYPHEVFGIVGESGSGKSLTMLAVMGLLSHPLRLASGSVKL